MRLVPSFGVILYAVIGLHSFACGSAETATAPGPTPCGGVDLDGGGGIPLPPYGAASCVEGPCNYQTQEGCGEEQACRPLVSPGVASLSAGCEEAGSGTAGDACERSTECARGFVCVGETEETRKCRRLCCGADWSACDAGESCIRQLYIAFDDAHREYAADLCFPVNDCDLFDPEACADPTRECKIVDPTGAVACAPRGEAGLGEPCSEPNVCAQGFTCVGPAGGVRICRRLCRAEQCGDPQCPVEEGICVHFDHDPEGVGECTVGRGSP